MTCRVCSNTADNRAYLVREMMFGFRDQFAYFECSRCGCLQIGEFPLDMAKYYPPEYYSFSPQESISSLKSPIRRLAVRARNRYAILGRGPVGRLLYAYSPNQRLKDWIAARFPGDGVIKVNLTPRCRILDVGCGSGELLLALQAAGFSSLLGIDAYLKRDLTYPGGLRILKRSIRETTGEGEWDLVMFHHSFEHMADPQETLAAAARLLAPTGTCLIRVPLAASYAWQHYRVDWVQLDAPRHFFLHSLASMTRITEQAGFETTRVVHDSGPFQFFGSELYRRDIPLHSMLPVDLEARAAAFTREELAAFERRARELNSQGTGDQAAFYLKKMRRRGWVAAPHPHCAKLGSVQEEANRD
jgi:2-polyprenyl-3-methyl-5-hydroxy-6-metoxy-1,4-benzoquinol methylase